jgi:uncharacterized HAD superfamily protein
MKPRLIIGVDMDDVIFSFNDSLHAYHNAKYGTSVKREDITSYNLEDVWKCTSKEVDDKLTEFFSTKEHDKAVIIPGSFEALAKLKKVNDLHVITSRGDWSEDITLRWIDKNFPEHFKSVSLTNQSLGSPGKRRSKAEVCRELKVDVMIEDSLSQAKEISAVVSRVFLLDCPWNQGDVPENVTRVFSWGEIVKNLLNQQRG